jgi:hypothetical protein
MTHYFSLVSNDYYIAKNKLEADAHKMIRPYNKLLIKAEDLKNFKDELKTQIDLLNQKHSRCKPLEFHCEACYNEKQSCFIEIRGVFRITMYACTDYKTDKAGHDPAYDLMGDMKPDAE